MKAWQRIKKWQAAGGIPKASVRAFLEKERDDFRVCKRLSLERLERMQDELPVRPPIWEVLSKSQKVCFIIGAMTERFYYANDMGTGKTLLSIALSLYFMKLGKVKRCFIFVPYKVNKYEWVVQLELWAPDYNFLVLDGSSKEKWDALLEDDSPFVIETYGGFVRLASNPKKGSTKLEPDRKKVSQFQDMFQMMVLDELTQAKSKMALIFRLLRFMSKTCFSVFGLSGTPFGRDPADFWSQLYLIDHGSALGETLGLFRAGFYTSTPGYFGGMEHKFNKKMRGVLNRLLAHSSIRYEADEADLPEALHHKIEVLLPKATEPYYEEQRKALLAAKGNHRLMKNAFLRMRQISSGFIGFHDDDLGTKSSFEFPTNPKLEALISLIQSTEKQVVVFTEFRWSGDRICAELQKFNVSHVQLYGKTKDPDAIMKTFHRGDAQVMVLNNTVGAFGLDRLKVAQYGIYYESPVSSIQRRQTWRRIQRQGSKYKTVFIYDLLVKDTADERIYEWNLKGKDIFESVMNGKVKL